ncbi:concanavalin A-like lectin/glucanase domain-containing protein [Phaeosphaeria sp. MPI-PUGE-AT-0046c]|nr:concanavalin A-like lectin/glucanase domain-containing protein [Phaeosphaeria sp. MPI-PUGE-AT-0046c]
MAYLRALVLPLAALLTPAIAANAYSSSNSQTPKDGNSNCSCYAVSSGADEPQYFQYYRFYDFQNLAGGLVDPPPLINDSQDATQVPTWQPKIFNNDGFLHDWGVQNWSKKATEDFPVPMSNSYANIYVGEEDGKSFLTLRTSRLDDHQTAGEIENQQKNLFYVSMRMYGRVVGDPGAVAGFFTFFNDENESDVEILTRDPKNQTRYTNQPSVGKDGNEIAEASVGPTNLAPWNEWQTHRIDWIPDESFWYLNGKQVAANTYSVPRKPSYLVLNMWGDGGEWSGNMSVGDHAEFQIRWIEMAFNTSGPYTGSQKNDKRSANLDKRRKVKTCGNVCRIDDVKERGVPEIASYGADGEEDIDDLSPGAKAGIAVGVILFVVVLAGVGWFFWRRRRAMKPPSAGKEGHESTADQAK